jgi:hypothetical protein
MKPSKEDAERCERAVSALTEVAEQLHKSGEFTELNVMGLICTMAVRWAKYHGISPASYAKINNELLDEMVEGAKK